MKTRSWRRSGRSALAGLLLLGACSGDLTERIRSVTYPPATGYVPPEDVRTAMRELSSSSHEISRLLRKSEGPGEVDRAAILARIREMEIASRTLGARGWPTNHPMISAKIDVFLDDVVRARRDVELEPPRYALAGSVAGACAYCHTPR
jgi:hypothetical protein